MTIASAGFNRGWILRALVRLAVLVVAAGYVAFMVLVFPNEAAASGVDRDSPEGGRIAGVLVPIGYVSVVVAGLVGVWLSLDVARAIRLSFDGSGSGSGRDGREGPDGRDGPGGPAGAGGKRMRVALPWVAAVTVLAAVACATLSVAVILESTIAGIGVDADQTKYWGSTGTIVGEALIAACLPFVLTTGVALALWTVWTLRRVTGTRAARLAQTAALRG